MDRLEFISNNSDETKRIAFSIAGKLKGPCVILLSGDLGAGKTVFAKGFVSYFVKDADVVSPTFAIVNSYEDKVYHFDLYRIESENELFAIGAYEYFYSDKYSLVEWPERVSRDIFPKGSVQVTIEKIGEDKRKIVVEGI